MRTPLCRGARTAPRARVLLVLTVVAAGLFGGPAAATTSSGGRSRPDLAGAFIGGINQARASQGRSRLAVDSTLTSVARAWAVSMTRTGVLAHNPRLATSVRGWHFLGENVGVGDSFASLQQAFWASAVHRANMLDHDFTRIGVAAVEAGGGRLWVVEDFSRPADVRPVARSSAQHPVRRSSARPRAVATRSPVDALALACARQAARLFRARHRLRQDVVWTQVRAGMRASVGAPA